jgi:hypothetical protein
MARGHGRILTTIWRDKDFRALDHRAQRLYFLLLSQPDLTLAGSIIIGLNRWAGYAADTTPTDIEEALKALESAGFVFCDHDEQEAFVPAVFTIDNIPSQPKRVIAAQDAISRIYSPKLRALASAELAAAREGIELPAPTGLRLAVFERDGYVCVRCGWRPGDPVPLTKTGRPVYRGLEIDHIHPRHLGGTDEMANLQVLCTSCNASKGAKV